LESLILESLINSSIKTNTNLFETRIFFIFGNWFRYVKSSGGLRKAILCPFALSGLTIKEDPFLYRVRSFFGEKSLFFRAIQNLTLQKI